MKILAAEVSIHKNTPKLSFGNSKPAKNPIEKFLTGQKISGKRRFTEEEIKNISGQVELNRKKYNMPKDKNDAFIDALQEMVSFKKNLYFKKAEPYLSTEDIVSLLSLKSQTPNRYIFNRHFLDYFGMRNGISGKDIRKIRDAAEGHEFCGSAIEALLTINDRNGDYIHSVDDICEILKYADIKAGSHGLYDIIKTRIYDDKISEKRFMKKDELIKILSENGKGFCVRTSPSGIRIYHQGNIKNYELSLSGIEQKSSETQIIDNNAKTVKNKRIYTDGRQNYCVMGFGNHAFQNSFSAVYDNENNRLYYEQLRPCKTHPDIFLLNKLVGKKEEKLAYIKQIPNGLVYEKNFVSPEGLKTNQIITEKGNERTSEYVIKDEKGKTLFNQKREFKQINDNYTQSRLNGQKYDMKFLKDKIEVTKEGEQAVILNRRLLNMKLMNLYKKLPGDVLSLIHSLGVKVELIEKAEDCMYYDIDKTIYTVDDAGIFMHEFGHAIDHLLFNSGFREKLAKVYRTEFSEISRNTNDLTVGSLDKFEKLNEFIAEGYQILSGYFVSEKNVKHLGIRTINMQRYLQKSMTMLAKQCLKQGII